MSLLNKIDHHSMSSMTTWLKCPRQWWVKKVLGMDTPAGPAASFGSQYDMFIAQKLGCKIGKPEKLPEVWQEGVEDAATGYLCQPHALKTATIAQAPIRVSPDEWELLCEMQDIGSIIKKPIIGFADLIDEERRIVVDLKTSGRKDTRMEWALQVIFYSIAMSLTEARIHLFTTTKVGAYYDFMVPIHKQSKRWAMNIIGPTLAEMEQALIDEAGEDLPRRPDYSCNWCPEAFDCCAKNLFIGG